MLRIVVMVSGGGTNLQAIIDGVKNGTITNTEIAGVISNNVSHRRIMRAGRYSTRSFSRRWTSTVRI